jgi:hypothetical protein
MNNCSSEFDLFIYLYLKTNKQKLRFFTAMSLSIFPEDISLEDARDAYVIFYVLYHSHRKVSKECQSSLRKNKTI